MNMIYCTFMAIVEPTTPVNRCANIGCRPQAVKFVLAKNGWHGCVCVCGEDGGGGILGQKEGGEGSWWVGRARVRCGTSLGNLGWIQNPCPESGWFYPDGLDWHQQFCWCNSK